MTGIRRWTGSTIVAGALVLSACSSSGGSGGGRPSESDVLSKVKTDSDVTALKAKLPAAAQSKWSAIQECVAKALHKDADAGALRDYVDGKKSIDKLSGDQDQAQKDVQTCVTSVVSGS